MLDLAFSNIRSQRTRTLLTIIGIVIGITAVVALGSFAEGINIMVNDELGAIAGKIIVTQKGSGGMTTAYSGSDITPDQLEMMKSLSGIEKAVPVIVHIEGGFGIGSGMPDWYAIGMDIDSIDLLIGKNIAMEDGARYEPGDRDVAVIGSKVAEKLNLKAGDFFTVVDSDFLITGVSEETGIQDIDSSVIVPIEDMQSVLGTENYQLVYVVPENPENVEIVADEISSMDDNLDAITSKDIARQMADIIGTIRIVTFGVGAIAAFVGGLGVLNTMIMAVMERRREIGVMKAVGATKKFLLVQIITESSMISMIGGLTGLALGFIASIGFSFITGGTVTAVVTPGLAIGSLLFALCLGVFGGLYPAWQAAKLDPVDALRS